MIAESGQGKYYLYRHIRLDLDKPFYIGIGTKSKKGNPYYRSISKEKRNSIWKNIVNKTEYEVEIILESNDYDFIKEKEKEFIILYGRKDLKTGILSNMTSGGEGVKDVVYTEERKEKLSIKFKGRTCLNKDWWDSTIDQRKRGSNHQCAKKVYQYDLNGNFIKEWGSAKDVKTELQINITKTCVTNGGFQWKRFYKPNIGQPNWENRKNTPVKVVVSDKDKIPFVCFYKIIDVAKFFDAHPTTVKNAIDLKFKLKRKYYINYYDDTI